MAKPELEVGETVRWSKMANYSTGGRAVGGKLYVTDRRFFFRPHALDRLTGGKSMTTLIDYISKVDLEEPGGGPFSGGLRTRLRVETSNGGVHIFVVNDAEAVVSLLTEAAVEDGAGEKSFRDLTWEEAGAGVEAQLTQQPDDPEPEWTSTDLTTAPPMHETRDIKRERINELTRLAELHAAGALTDEEFATMKARVIEGG